MITESINKDTFDKWKREALIWADNMDKIKTGDDLIKCINGYGQWIKAFYDFLNLNMMGKGLNVQSYVFQYKEAQKEDKALKSAIENFFKDWTRIFSFPANNYAHSDTGESLHPVGNSYDYVVSVKITPDTKKWWNTTGIKIWNEWPTKTGMKADYKKAVSKLFNNLTRLLTYAEKTLNDPLANYYQTRQVKIEDTSILFSYVDSQELGNRVPEYTRIFQKAFGLIKSKGLGKTLRGLKIRVDFQEKNPIVKQNNQYGASWGVGGMYHPGDSLIRIRENSIKSTDVIIHEIGHRYYYEFMAKDGIKRWKDYYDFGKVDSKFIPAAFWSELSANIKTVWKAWQREDARNRLGGLEFKKIFWKEVSDELQKSMHDPEIFKNFKVMEPELRNKIDVMGGRWQDLRALDDTAHSLILKNGWRIDTFHFVFAAIEVVMNKWMLESKFDSKHAPLFWQEVGRQFENDAFKQYLDQIFIKFISPVLDSLSQIEFEIQVIKQRDFALVLGSVTNYGMNSADEFYAETFQYYCQDKKIPENTYRMFKLVSGLI